MVEKMVSRAIFTGTDNDGFRHRYSFKKNEKFKKFLTEFIEELGFDTKKIKELFNSYDKDEIPITLKVKDINDHINHFQNKKYDIDIFWGNKKIILIIRTKKRIPMIEFLKKDYMEWIEPPKPIENKNTHTKKIHIQKPKYNKAKIKLSEKMKKW
ncbi:hypothetical protein KAR91_78175 [Candidatus Pacearchaeota archaeon]|nr:hypothetical protein [Candidatus Pacearchaeota archaeon]